MKKQREFKVYYVECVGYSTRCNSYKDALDLYRYRKLYEDEVKLTNIDGKVIYSFSR